MSCEAWFLPKALEISVLLFGPLAKSIAMRSASGLPVVRPKTIRADASAYRHTARAASKCSGVMPWIGQEGNRSTTIEAHALRPAM